MTGAAPTILASGDGARIVAFDGLRGIAAVIVVVFHYICLLHWPLTPRFSTAPPAIADTPLGLLWNGPFAVSVFFVLSGFAMAGAAERRRTALMSNLATRYLRLAVPVVVSTLLAWLWLRLAPAAAAEMAATDPAPSPWLRYTYQETTPGLHLAVADGLVANFLRGYSYFNNVLWTMQIELLGSFMLFAIYWLAESRPLRLWSLVLAGAGIFLFFSHHYLGFVVGALLYEASRAGLIDRLPPWTGFAAFVAGVLLGAPSDGFHVRMGLPDWPSILYVGRGDGIWAVVAAASLLYAALTLGWLASLLSRPVPQFLGRISFALYLVHVPLLYTVVAVLYLDGRMSQPLIALSYAALVLGLSIALTNSVDAPMLRALRRLRRARPLRHRRQT